MDTKAEDKVNSKKTTAILHGRASKKGVTEADVDPKELADGIKVEAEHTDDPAVAKLIALDHLAEYKHYYTGLKKMEKELKDSGDSMDNPIKSIKTISKEEYQKKNGWQKTNIFEEVLDDLMKETTMAAPDGAFGDIPSGEHGGAVGNSDWYATGDARNLFGSGELKKKKKGTKSIYGGFITAKQGRKQKGAVITPVMRRTFPKAGL